MSLSLIRNSRVFFTTNLTATGAVAASGFTATNTFEIQVLDGFSFSQNTTSETVTLSEAGATPLRGQRSFNTALEPVDWSFSTYMRPAGREGATVTGGADADDVVGCEEEVLWNAMASNIAIGTAGAAWVRTAGITPVSTLSFTNSNKNQLQAFGLVIVFDNLAYAIDNCAIESASIDFAIDAIATIAWTGRGTNMRQLAAVTLADNTGAGTVALSGGLTGTGTRRNTTAGYLANKLSTLTIASTAFGGQSVVTYANIAITGGNLTINNNLTYLTPANLGVVNTPITYFTGTRAITGSVTAYLRAGAGTSSALLSDILSRISIDDENQYDVNLAIGGSAATTRVDVKLPRTMLSIPTIQSEQVISTTINLMPQGGTGTTFDITQDNELTIEYRAPAP